MGDRHAEDERCCQTKVGDREGNARADWHIVVFFHRGHISSSPPCPELRRSQNNKQEQPEGEVAVEPLPDLKGEQAKKADDPDAPVDGTQHAPAVERQSWYQVEQVHKETEVGQRRPYRGYMGR